MLRKPAIEGSNTVTEKLVAEVQPTEHPAFNEFVATIEALRSPDGCPWDKEQTHKSISGNMVEEAYEAVDAIEADDVSAVLAGAGSAPTSALKSGAEHAEFARENKNVVENDVEKVAEKRRGHRKSGRAVVADEVLQNVVEHKKGSKAKYNLHVGFAP